MRCGVAVTVFLAQLLLSCVFLLFGVVLIRGNERVLQRLDTIETRVMDDELIGIRTYEKIVHPGELLDGAWSDERPWTNGPVIRVEEPEVFPLGDYEWPQGGRQYLC